MMATQALQLTRPDLAVLREVRDWKDLGRLWPADNATSVVGGWADDLTAWASLERGFGNQEGAEQLIQLAASVLLATEYSLLVAYDNRTRAARASLPPEVAKQVTSIDDAYRDYLLGDEHQLEAAERAWIELARSGSIESLEPALGTGLYCDGIALHSAVHKRSGDPQTLAHLTGLLELVLSRTKAHGDPQSDTTAIYLVPSLARITGETGLALRRLYDATGNSAHLARAARVAKFAFELCSPGSPEQAPWLLEAVHTRAWAASVPNPVATAPDGEGDSLADSDEAMQYVAESEPKGTRVRGRALDLLAQLRWDTYRRSHDPADLDSAINDWRTVLAEKCPRPPMCGDRLASALLTRFLEEADEDETDLETAIGALDGPTEEEASVAQRLLAVLKLPILNSPDGVPPLTVKLGIEALSRLSPEPATAHRAAEIALHLRDDDRGETRSASRDLSIDLLHAATMLDPSNWAIRSDRAGALSQRFDASGNLGDLHMAIDELHRAVADGSDSTGPGPFINLAGAYYRRWALLSRGPDLTAAQAAASRAVELAEATLGADGPAKYEVGLALGMRAMTNFETLEMRDSALDDWRRLLDFPAPEQHSLAAYNLGNVLLERALAQASPDLGVEALGLLNRAVDDLEHPSVDSALAANRLAEALNHFGVGDVTDDVAYWGKQAVAWASTTSAETLHRVAWDTAVRSAVAGDWGSAGEDYRTVVSASRRLRESNQGIDAQDAWVRLAYGASTRAAHALIHAGRTAEAVRVLEDGRTLLLRDVLGVPSIPESSDGESRCGLGTTEPDHARFDGVRHPLLYIVPGTDGGYGILLEPDGGGLGGLHVSTVSLNGLTEKKLGEQVRDFRTGIMIAGSNVTSWRRTLRRVSTWIGETLAPALTILAAMPGERVTLVPTGALAFLPVHMAAHADGRTLVQTKIVLFAPSATILTAAASRPSPAAGSVLAVADPTPTSLGSLPFAALEAGLANGYAATQPGRYAAPGGSSPLTLAGADATWEKVRAALPDARLFHAACHGTVDLCHPLASGLLMSEDHLLSVPALGNENLSRLRLAVLSACETGIPGQGAPDELISLSGVLQSAGADGVVSSLWRISDAATLMVIALFYAELMNQPEDPAAALTAAQRRMIASSDGELIAHLRELQDADRVTKAVVVALEKWLKGLPAGSRELSEPDAWAAFAFSGF